MPNKFKNVAGRSIW